MENDFRNSDKFPPDRNLPPQRSEGSGTYWIPVVVIAGFALVAFFAMGGGTRTLETPPADLSSTSEPVSNIEPAEGSATAEQHAAGVTATDATVEGSATATSVVPVAETTGPVEAANSIHTYAAEEECAEATGASCHYITCDSIPEGKQPDEVCGPGFKKGWQPIVPTPNKTAVPEKIAPPLSGQSDVPVEEPPLTGQ